MDHKFLTVREISEYLALKVSTLYVKVEERSIPHYRIGRRVQFRKTDIEEWIDQHKVETVDSSISGDIMLNSCHSPKILV
jgi:excisionase family DNA binding protein